MQPYVYDECTQVMISYDDATSFEAKGAFVAKNNMRGFAQVGSRSIPTRRVIS